MATIDQFISQFSDQLIQGKSTGDVSDQAPNIVLTGILLGFDDNHLTFSHLGMVFQVRKDDVFQAEESAEPTPNPYGKGIPCSLVIKGDAQLTRTLRIHAKQLVQNTPYVVARPSRIQPFNPDDQEVERHELEWLANRGVHIPTVAEIANSPRETMRTTYTGTESSQATYSRTTTQSGGASDDSSVDDSPSDSMGRDDANSDDVAADATISTEFAATTYTGTESSQTTYSRTTTQSAGVSDDSSVDDSPSDGMGRDDANQDDM